MSNSKKKYYALDDLHFIGDPKMTKKQKEESDKKTSEFFAKRRGLKNIKKKPKKVS